ncbi:hypothetical protein LTR17_008895 [Elasticomyces elasticus]|nr:hypothetical protein LTR17_008895 [Elasticomyces elasticus]
MAVDNENLQVIASEVVHEQPKRKWQSYIWDSLDKSPEERKFLFKLDCALLTFASLGYFIKYLNQSNINNAFVSGMQEDLGLYKNQLNYMQTLWTVGYVIGQIPSNLILTRVRPSIWIPTLEITWTVLTFSLSRCNTAEQIYAVRFLVGPGMQYIIGSWYRKDELAKRSCIFHTASAIATMFSGYLMAAVYNLDGKGGFKGWTLRHPLTLPPIAFRLFVIDGVISLPIALSGYFFLPDTPETCRAFYLTPKERDFGRKRMELEGRKGRAPYTRAKVARIFSSWHIYLLTLLYICFNNGNSGASPAFAQFLRHSKDPKYAIWQINVYPTTTSAVQVVTTLAYAWTSDSIFKGARWPPIIIGGVLNIFCYISLAIWDIPSGFKWFCLILMGSGFGLSGLCFAWAHEICSDDNEERALVTGTMNELAYVFQAWLPLLVWQQVDAPEYQKGYITVTCLSALMIATALIIRPLHKREDRLKALNAEHDTDHDSETSSTPVEVQVSSKKI